MKLHLPVRLRASLIAAVIAVASGIYNAHANDITGTNIPFSEVYNHTSGNTYTATNDITFQATQQTQGVFASFISGDTTLTAGNAVVFANHFGANTTDLVPSQEKQYDGKLNIVTDKIQVASGGNQVVLEDVKVGKKTAATGEVNVGSLSELVVLNGDISTLSDSEKKTLHAEGLVNTPTCEQRSSTQQTVVMGALTGSGNFAVYGDEDDTDAVRVASIGTSGTTFGNVSAANESLNITGAVYANTLVAVRSDVNAGQAVTLVGLDLDADSTLTSVGDIDAGDTTGHVAVYGEVESTGGNVHLIHGNKSDKDGLHEGSSVKAAEKATIEDLNAVLAEVEGTHGVDILNGCVVEGSTVTSGSESVDADIMVSKSTLKAHEGTDTVLNSTQDITVTTASNVTGTEMNADRNVIVSGGADVSGSDISAVNEIVVTGTGTTMHGAVDLHDALTVRVQDGANFAIDGGSVDVDVLAIESAKNDLASVTDSEVDLTTTKIDAGETLVYDGSTGDIGYVVQNGEGSAVLKVTGEADLTSDGISSNDARDSYFGKVQVDGAAELDVTGNAKISTYVAADDGTKVTFEETVSIKNAHINDSGEETIAEKDAHIGNLNLADGGVLTIDNTDAKNQSYIANISSAADGTINVVNGTVDTPVLNHEDLVLGLNGGTVVLKGVSEAMGAGVPSASPVNPHVSLDSITNAGVESPIGNSTICTSLHRYYYNGGSENSADLYTYYYVARVDGRLNFNGRSVEAGDLVKLTDVVETTTLLTGEVVNSGVDLTSAATLSDHDALILDRLTQPMLDEYGEFILGTPETLLTGQVRSLDYTAVYYDGVDDWYSPETDGIASLTLQGDFGSDQTTINAYRVVDYNEHDEVWVVDTNSGSINIGGDITGNDNKLYADAYIETGVVSGDCNILGVHNPDRDPALTVCYIEAAGVTGDGNNLIADDYVTIGYIGEETDTASLNTVDSNTVTVTGDIVGDENVLTAHDGSVTVRGNITGDDNELGAETYVKTGDITGDGNKLDAVTYIETGVITGDGNDLSAEEDYINTGDIIGNGNELTSHEEAYIITGNITGNENHLYSATDSVETGLIKGDDNYAYAGTGMRVSAIEGDRNELYTYEDDLVVTNSVTGDTNWLQSDQADIEVGGDVTGDANTLLSLEGESVNVTGTVDGEGNYVSARSGDISLGGIAGQSADVTAWETVNVGDVTGTDHYITSFSGDRSKDEIAIEIGNFAAQGTNVEIRTYSDPDYGNASGFGSILVHTMSAVDEYDEDAWNYIHSPSSYVEVGALQGSNANTEIDAATGIYLGYRSETTDTASNLDLFANFVMVGSQEGLVLTDSDIQAAQTIQGTSLTLDGDSTASTAGVYFDNLTLGGNAVVRAAQVQIQDKLTIVGKYAKLDATSVSAKSVQLSQDADFSSVARVSDMEELTLSDHTSVELTNRDHVGDVAITVEEASALTLGNGAEVKSVTVDDTSALQIGDIDRIDSVKVGSLALAAGSDVTLDLDLTRNTIDEVVADEADLGGVTLKLNAWGDESKVADQTRIDFIDGAVTADANDYVEHSLRTLNAYADGNSIVLSKNFRSVEGLTHNQRNASAALADLEDHIEVRGDMADVMDALHHTRSAEETRDALDSLGGVGLSAIAKMATDDEHDHIQAMRANYQALAAGIDYRYDEQGNRIAGLQSSAISAAVTGGTTDVSGSDGSPKYSRNSIGALVSGVHAFSHDWVGGMSLGYTRSDGDCGTVSMKSDALYLDAALIRRTKWTTHTATLGMAHFDINEDRMINVGPYSSSAHGGTSATLVELSYEAVVTIARKDRHAFAGVFQTDLVFGQFDTFTESGADTAGIRTAYDDVASVNFGIGGRYTYSWGSETNPGYFDVEALFVADAGDRTAVVKNTFLAGGQTFEQLGPDAGACGLRLNAGVLVPAGKQWGVFGNVTSEFRAEQSSVSGSVGVKFAF
ncbi:MAG: autotransporter outer membrane beta-barrel domain-containing protein [Akkermansia sp.]|nr:autotransporter outer membrane beta-barrel domain-containing protein [Akkermansia sp.]